jgi:tetratricopeptide (TPR) repeat protein
MLKRHFGVIPGLMALVVYFTTTCRSIWIGDSGEFALAMKTLGICHPPGYPLFTICGRIFVLALPFLRPVFAAGLFNILVAAAAVSVIYFIFSRYLSRWSALFLSLIWGFTPVFWEETTGIEIYTLNLLLMSIIFLTLERKKAWKWPLATYLFALSLANHPSALTLLPVMVFMFIRDRQYANWKMFPLYISLIMVAGSIYLYLPIRSSLAPVSNWGEPSSLKTLFNHMTLSQYSGWINYSWENLALSAHLFFVSLLKSWWWIGAIVTVCGILTGYVVARIRTISALFILATSLILASSHRALNYEPFYIPAVFASLLLCGNLFVYLEKRLRSNSIKYPVMAALPAACLILLLHNYRDMNRSGYALAEQYGRHMLDTAGDGILFTAGDINSFPSLYLRYAEGYAPDVEVYDRSVRLADLMDKARRLSGREVSGYHNAREILLKQAKGRKYLAKIHYVHEPDWLELSEPIYSYGLLYSVGEKPVNNPSVLKYPDNYEIKEVLSRQLLVNLDLARGKQLLYENPEDSSSAPEAFATALKRLDDEPQAVVLNNVGIYFRNAGHTDLALDVYRRALEKPIVSREDRRDIMYNISNVYKDIGNGFLESQDYRNAVASYEEALAYDRNNPTLLLNVGLIYARALGDTVNARSFLERYLALNPADSRVREYLQTLK